MRVNSLTAQSGDYDATAEFYDHFPLYRDRTDVSFFVEMAREGGRACAGDWLRDRPRPDPDSTGRGTHHGVGCIGGDAGHPAQQAGQ